MARKPKDVILDSAESVEEESDDTLDLSEDDNETALDLDEEDEDDKPAKGKARRKRKEPVGFAAQLLANSSESTEKPAAKVKEEKAEVKASEQNGEKGEEAAEAPALGTDISDDAPEKKTRRPRSTTEEKNLSVAMVSAFEAMTSHWTTAKEATDALVANLEKVKKDLEEIKEASAEPLKKLVDQTKEKQAVASRVMFALSLGAIIFSFVSLTLSQSVRGQLLAVQKPVERPVYQTKSAPLTAPVVPQQQAQTNIPPQPRSVPMPNANALAATNAKSLARVGRLPKSTKKQ